MGIKDINKLVDKYAKTYSMTLENAKAQAAEKGCGVMTIGQEEILVCKHVPAGRVFHAGNREAYLKFLANREEAAKANENAE